MKVYVNGKERELIYSRKKHKTLHMFNLFCSRLYKYMIKYIEFYTSEVSKPSKPLKWCM